jgi:hypothetical protein
MSGFVNSIVRGAGMSIGRNLVGDFGRIKKPTTSSHRYYDRAENEMEKALNFPIKGRSETILGNCFNMYQSFDDETCEVGSAISLMLRSSRFKYYKECLEKVSDCKEYLELKNKDDENIQKLDEIYDKINDIFFKYVHCLCRSIPLMNKSKDKETARDAWFGYKDGSDSSSPLNKVYPQLEKINPKEYNPNLISEIENHLKSNTIFGNSPTKSESSFPVLIGLLIGGIATYWMWNHFIK